MPVRQPLTQARRQQQLLLTITRQEVLAHHTTPASTTSTRMVLTAPDSTNPAEARFVRQPRLRVFLGVGETGFEPATARPPAGCATRLRHSPWSVSLRQIRAPTTANARS